MKKILLLSLLVIFLMSCSKDDDDAAKCLVCTSFGSADMTSSELNGLCVGASDPETGVTLDLESLQVWSALLNAFGASCAIE